MFDVYAERHNLDLDIRETLEQELALDQGGFRAGGTTTFDVTSRPSLTGPPAVAPRPNAPPAGRAPGGGGGGGAAAAIYAQLVITSAGFGWSQGRQARIEREGEPTFIHTNPLTGYEAAIDPNELADLTPDQAKAYIAHFAATGTPPPTISTTIEPHPYLDQYGQWRMSDTNEPVWIPPPDGQFYDSQGRLRYTGNNELVDAEPEPEPAADGAGARDGSDDDVESGGETRIFNVTRAESKIWAGFKPFRGKTRTNGLSGRDRRYYEWDGAHNDIEVYDQNGQHLGSLNPTTGTMYKPANPRYSIDV